MENDYIFYSTAIETYISKKNECESQNSMKLKVRREREHFQFKDLPGGNAASILDTVPNAQHQEEIF